MEKNKCTEEQISYVLKQVELGAPVAEVCRKIGVTEQTFYRWKSKYGGMLPNDIKHLRHARLIEKIGLLILPYIEHRFNLVLFYNWFQVPVTAPPSNFWGCSLCGLFIHAITSERTGISCDSET
jgi:hypothetical protein